MTVLMALCAVAQVKPGIEVLRDGGFEQLKGKRVGLLTNPTGVDNKLKSTVDILHEAANVELVALLVLQYEVLSCVVSRQLPAQLHQRILGPPVVPLRITILLIRFVVGQGARAVASGVVTKGRFFCSQKCCSQLFIRVLKGDFRMIFH